MKKAIWIIFAALSTLIGLYPLIYLFLDKRFGLLATKTPELLNSGLYNVAFFGHILFGGLALAIGWLQFNTNLRKNKIKHHRRIGRVYIFSALISGICGFYIGFYATGGIVSILGFISLAVIWLTTTTAGFLAVLNRKFDRHEKLMIFSYAACFAGVTLRIWLPILSTLLGDFLPAYQIVAWLCWLPNIIVAYFIVRWKNVNRALSPISH